MAEGRQGGLEENWRERGRFRGAAWRALEGAQKKKEKKGR